MTFININNNQFNHWYCFIRNFVAETDNYAGLSHVSEHTCLIPYYEKYSTLLNSHANGYTCLDHVSLYYASTSNKWLQNIRGIVTNGTIIKNSSVEVAKHQVIHECNNLKEITTIREKIVSFVTENRIKQFAMGNIEEIELIKTVDVFRWLKNAKKCGNFYEFMFYDVMELEVKIGEYIANFEEKREKVYCKNKNEKDDYIFAQLNSVFTGADIYIRLPIFFKKEQYILLAFTEYCLKRLSEKYMNIEVDVIEKFFTYAERYIVIKTNFLDKQDTVSYIDKLRDISSSSIVHDFIKLIRVDFIKFVEMAFLQEKKSYDCINEFQNYILYDKPVCIR